MASKTAVPAPLATRIGACGAVGPAGSCSCTALAGLRDIAGYPTCICGHTQHSHAVPVPALPLAG